VLVLGIETSCDDTSAALVEDRTVLSNLVASQDALHADYGGVVPELAARRHLETVQTVIERALELVEATAGGLLVEAGSAPALADGIEELMEEEERRLELGRAGMAAVHAEFARLPKERVYRPREDDVPPPLISTEPPSRKEEWLLRLAFHDAAFGDWVAAQLNPEWVEHSGVRHILERAPELGMDAGALVSELDEANARLLTGTLAADEPIPNPAHQLADLVGRLRAKLAHVCLDALEPDLVIMDIAMPGMDGITALKRIKSLQTLFRISSCGISTTMAWPLMKPGWQLLRSLQIKNRRPGHLLSRRRSRPSYLPKAHR